MLMVLCAQPSRFIMESLTLGLMISQVIGLLLLLTSLQKHIYEEGLYCGYEVWSVCLFLYKKTPVQTSLISAKPKHSHRRSEHQSYSIPFNLCSFNSSKAVWTNWNYLFSVNMFPSITAPSKPVDNGLSDIVGHSDTSQMC